MTEKNARRHAWRPGYEWALAAVCAVGLAVAMTWPALAHPMSVFPGYYGDPGVQAWAIAWDGHALLTDPAHLWQANAFYPERDSLAFGDAMLGYAPAGMIGSGPEAAILRYNLLFVLAFALASFGAYALARQLGAARVGAIVAGVAFAYAPWRLGHVEHLNVLSSGGMPLALAMLARGHGWRLRPGSGGGPRPGWAIAGWAVAAWQVTLGFALGLPFVYVMLAGSVILAIRYGVRRSLARRLVWADLAGGAVFAAVALLMAQPYIRVARDQPGNERTVGYLRFFSPHARDFLVAPERDRLWAPMGETARLLTSYPEETSLLPGFAVLTLAALGLFISVWRLRWRVVLAAGVLLAGALALGPNLGRDGDPGYMTLFRFLPGWDSMRTPGRLIVWAMLPLVLLAAGTVTAALAPAPAGDDPRLRVRLRPLAPGAAAMLLAAVVAVEGLHTTTQETIPVLTLSAAQIEEPMLLLPIGTYVDNAALLESTDAFLRMPNGAHTIVPRRQYEIRKATAYFPDADSVAYLRGLGIRTVVVLPGVPDLQGRTYDTHKSIEGLGITRTDLDSEVIYHLLP